MNYNLESIKIESFKKLPSFEVELANINILVGTNGSGKSSVLQGIHLACCAMRQAKEVSTRGRAIPIGELDYLPTDAYTELGYNSPWGNKETSPSSKFTLVFSGPSSSEAERSPLFAWCELRAARNAGISIKGTIPAALQETLRKRIFSAYIPGISGIPNREEKSSKRVVVRACSFGDSNVYLRNILFLIYKNHDIKNLVDNINQIISPHKLSIEIVFDEEKDLAIQCFVSIDKRKQPIELIGTGYLQLIHIFAYILLLNPGLVLIDEPDNHLHPTFQERLIPVLYKFAAERGIKIVMATHSPYIIRGASLNAKVLWMNNGQLQTSNRNQIELALGWGLMGKKLLIISEDKDTRLLKRIISQWPNLERQISIHPGHGYQTLPKPEDAKEIMETLNNSVKILVHRDRDSLTGQEVSILMKKYNDLGISLWLPLGSDIESYFCNSNVIADLCGIAKKVATTTLKKAIQDTQADSNDKFIKHRAAHNKELWSEGGSPTNENVRRDLKQLPLKDANGKTVFNRINQLVSHNAFTKEAVVSATWNCEIASDLKTLLETLLSGE